MSTQRAHTAVGLLLGYWGSRWKGIKSYTPASFSSANLCAVVKPLQESAQRPHCPSQAFQSLAKSVRAWAGPPSRPNRLRPGPRGPRGVPVLAVRWRQRKLMKVERVQKGGLQKRGPVPRMPPWCMLARCLLLLRVQIDIGLGPCICETVGGTAKA